MKSFKIFIILLALVLLIVPTSVAGKGNSNFVFSLTNQLNTSGVVEQQSSVYPNCNPSTDTCVFNNTGCSWTLDSYQEVQAGGTLPSGGSSQITECLVSDWGQHLFGIRLTSSSPNLIVSVIFLPQNVTYTFTPRVVNGGYEYRGCVVGPFYSSQLPVIPNSNGGVGIQGVWRLIVTNPTNKQLRNISAFSGYGLNDPSRREFCQQPITDFFVDSGAIWQTGL